jgi:hypothetical protein
MQLSGFITFYPKCGRRLFADSAAHSSSPSFLGSYHQEMLRIPGLQPATPSGPTIPERIFKNRQLCPAKSKCTKPCKIKKIPAMIVIMQIPLLE